MSNSRCRRNGRKSILIQIASGGIGNALHFIPLMKALANTKWAITIWLTQKSHSQLHEIFQRIGNTSCWLLPIDYSVDLSHYDVLFLSKRQHHRDQMKPSLETVQGDIRWYDYYVAKAYDVGLSESEYKYSLARDLLGDDPMPDNNVTTHLGDDDHLAVFPGGSLGRNLKRWPYFPELCKFFEKVIVLGLPQDVQTIEWPTHVSFFRGTLDETVERIRHCKVFVGNCAGITNLATITGIPTIIIYGPTSEVKNCPKGPNVYQIWAERVPCRPCQRLNREIYMSENCVNRDCLIEISPKEVFEFICDNIHQC